MSSAILGVVNSSQRTLSGDNTTAGEWSVEFMWTNGTEIAYGTSMFDMYHSATINAQFDPIEINTGQSVTNWIFLRDADTNDFLMDETVYIVANWSSSTVVFTDNPSKNRWEGTFDTTIVGEGEFIVVVNASRPYFNNVSCTFIVISTYTTQISFPDIGGSPVESGLNEIYVLNIQYQLTNGTGVTDAAISFSYSGAASGLINGTYNDLGDGDYSIQITGVISGDYVVTIQASKAYHDTQSDSFDLTIGETGSFFESLNGTADSVGYGYNYQLVLNYTNSTGFGLIGASVQVTDVTPGTGLIVGSTNPEGGGLYSITFTPTIARTYTIVLKANITNHVTQYLTFSLLVVDTPTVLIPDSSGATISVDKNYTLQLTYQDSLSNPIDGASITVVNLPPDLAYVVTPLGSGVYNVTLIPSVTESKSFQLSFRASRINYQTSSTAFTLFVQTIPTDLVVIQGDTPGSVSVTDSYTIVVAYIRTDTGANITSADISIESTPSIGVFPTIQNSGDAYQLSFLFNGIGIWQITLNANRSSFVTAVLQIEVEVNPIDTFFVGYNGTADLVGFGNGYSLVVRYTNSTGAGISGAIIDVAEITPSTGITIGSTIDSGSGYYSILFSPTSATTFSIVLRANITNHVAQYLSFSLVVIPIQTTLTPQETEATISLDRNYTLFLTYKDEGDHLLTGANITVVNPPSNLDYLITEIGSGVYSVTLVPSVIGTTSFQMSFRANLTNHQSSTAAFSLLVQVIHTDLSILEGDESESISFLEEYSLTLAYVRTDIQENISQADIHVFFTPTNGPEYTIARVGNVYHLTFIGNQTGIWQITVTANKTNHVTSSLRLRLEVVQIDTSLNEITLVESLVYGRDYNFSFSYRQADSTGIEGVVPTISGSAAEWVSVMEGSDGNYILSLTPGSVGSFEVSLTFRLEGYVTRTTTLEFDVEEVMISIVDIQGLSALEGQIATLSLQLVDSETGAVISGATATYRLVSGVAPAGSTDVLLESETTPGQYSSSFIMPSYGSNAKIRIYVEMANHQLESQAEFVEVALTPTASELTTLTRTFTQYSPLILLAAVVVTGYAGRRSYTRRKRKENLEALS
ncbi:MAG: hypothetical protein ACFFF4_17900, partial [Candidatus Thorarchaeota archaeon]